MFFLLRALTSTMASKVAQCPFRKGLFKPAIASGAFHAIRQTGSANNSRKALLAHATAVVTGGGNGIGAALAQILSTRLSHVLIVDKDEIASRAVAEFAGNISYVVSDIGTDEGVEKVVRQLTDLGRKVDLLVNNAAVFNFASSQDVTRTFFNNAVNINIAAPLFLTNAFAREHLFASCASRVLMISSTAARGHYQPNMGLYVMTKSALFALQNVMAKDYQGRLLINSAYPGTVDTQVAQAGVAPNSVLPHNLQDAMKMAYKSKRILSPRESAEFLTWVLCDTSDETFTDPTKIHKPGSQPVNLDEWDIRDSECYVGCSSTAGSKLRGFLPAPEATEQKFSR